MYKNKKVILKVTHYIRRNDKPKRRVVHKM